MQYVYDDGGRIAESQDGTGAVISFRYDQIGRLESRTTNRRGVSVLLERVFWDVDPATGQPHGNSIGSPVRVDDESGFRELHYDGRGRNDDIRRCTNAAGQQICARWQIEFDVASRLHTITYPDSQGDLSQQSEIVEYGYDDFSRVTSLKSSLMEYLTKVTYGPDDRPEVLSLGNGIEEENIYEPVRQRISDRNIRVRNGDPLSLHYEYDIKGRTQLHSWSDSNQYSLTYDYDALDRLAAVRGDLNLDYEYDDLGRIVFANHLGKFEYNDPAHIHAVTRVNKTEELDYDKIGRLQYHDGEKYSWNEEGRLFRALTSAAGTVNFGYEPDGDRAFKTSLGTVSVYFDTIAQFDGTGFRYYYQVGSRVLAERDVNGDVVWNHTDLVGSVRAVSDRQGTIIKRFDYAPYGEDFLRVSSPASFAFSGDRYDEETRLTLMGARYYDSRLGRFISPDSIIPSFNTALGLDRYAYGFDSPTVLIDPTGFEPADAQKDQRNALRGPSGEKKPVRPNAIPEAVWCREHPASRECVAANDSGALDRERRQMDEAAAAGGMNKAAWDESAGRLKADNAEQQALNDSTEVERQRHAVGEKTGFNSLVRAVTADSGARQLSADEVQEEYKTGLIKLADTIDTTVTVVSVVGGLHAAGKMAASGAERAATACNGGCFTEHTQVATPDGPRAIADIKPGDEVLAYDSESNRITPRRVTRLYRRTGILVTLLLVGAASTEAMSATPDHPFLSCERVFVEAGALRQGDCIASDIGPVIVERVESTTKIEPVFNLEVEGLHTYLVGANRAVVHNGTACCLTPYSLDGGHHIPAKSAFRGEASYSMSAAPSIGQKELARLGVRHELVTGVQQKAYREFAKGGGTLGWKDAARIETRALVEGGGMSRSEASRVVNKAIKELQNKGVSGPTRIAWGGK